MYVYSYNICTYIHICTYIDIQYNVLIYNTYIKNIFIYISPFIYLHVFIFRNSSEIEIKSKSLRYSFFHGFYKHDSFNLGVCA